jgi:alkylation response protein AidB-like acyl-CoA dehydrogenase
MNVAQPALIDRSAAFEALLEAARTRRDEFAERQQISPDVVELMKDAGIFRALVAKRFGGDEMSPAAFMKMVEEISTADGSTGWVASFGFAACYLSALPLTTLETMYSNGPDVIFAGGLYPPQEAVPVAGGLEVSGKWGWGSGSTAADLIGVGISVAGEFSQGLPLTAVIPAERVRIVRNWEVIGLKGTGSHDMIVEKVVVPNEWTFVRGAASSLDTPLFRYPSIALAAQVLAVVGLGVARAALDELIGLAGGRASITGAPRLAERPYVQTEIAKAEAELRSARAFFYDTTEEVYATLLAGDDVTTEAKMLLRLGATHAARVGADVAQMVFRIAGTTGVFSSHPIANQLQDAIIVPQHAFLSDGTWQSAGKVLLGLENPPGFP